jgi:hypothetical protein
MKRTLLLGSAWTASAAAAVGLGFLAISLVDASASDGGRVLPASATTTADGSSSTATSAPAAAADGQQVTAGGTVYGSCNSGVPAVASAPAAGWWLDDSSDAGTVEFRNGTLKVEVRVTCVNGVAQFSVEGPRADNSGGGGDDGVTSSPSSSSPSSSSPSATTGDDSDGRIGGGHGADDVAPQPAATPTADDRGGASGGRNGGGHGSDG